MYPYDIIEIKRLANIPIDTCNHTSYDGYCHPCVNKAIEIAITETTKRC